MLSALVFASLSLLSLSSAAPTLSSSSSSFPTARTPLLAYSSPKPFLGLDDENGFDGRIGHVAFLPGFHACGTLSVFSVEPGLTSEDWDLLERVGGNSTTEGEEGEGEQEMGLWQRYESAPTRVRENEAVEGTILAWARGWRKTCGKGPENKEVRVTKVLVDGADPRLDRSAWVQSLDDHLRPLLSALPPAPHNNLVMITSLSPSTLLTLFDLASPPPSSSPKSPSSTPAPNPNLPQKDENGRWRRPRRSHGWMYRLIASIVSLAFHALLLAGLFFAGRKAYAYYLARKESRSGGVRLPLTAEGERELEFDLGEDEDAEGAEDLPRGAIEEALLRGSKGRQGQGREQGGEGGGR
ncbi:hypothetical protein JCM8547_000073 [Rhodosporidiobolus lusitaniae]